MGKDFQTTNKKDCGTKKAYYGQKSTQANAIIEKVHQVIGNIIRSVELEDNYLDKGDSWKGILSATVFAVRLTFHTTLQTTSEQLVFGRNMFFDIFHTANWKYIKPKNPKNINLNNVRENLKHIPHVYQIGNQVLLKRGTENKYESHYQGLFNILKVNNTGTVWLMAKSVKDTYSQGYLYHKTTCPLLL